MTEKYCPLSESSWKGKKFIMRLCAYCEYTYLGFRDCPKCEFAASYSAAYVYGGKFPALIELITNHHYREKLQQETLIELITNRGKRQWESKE